MPDNSQSELGFLFMLAVSAQFEAHWNQPQTHTQSEYQAQTAT